MYVYIRSEPSLWTVGFYDPSSKWVAESDCDSQDQAAHRVHFLNGGHIDQRLLTALSDLLEVIAADELIPESVSYMKQARAAVLEARKAVA